MSHPDDRSGNFPQSTTPPSAKGEPVAWRWRLMLQDDRAWIYGHDKPNNLNPMLAWQVEPLFVAPATVPTTAARADYQASSPCPKGNTKELDGRCFGCDCGLPTHEDCCRFVAHMFGETHPAARDRILELIAENAARRATPSTLAFTDDVLSKAREFKGRADDSGFLARAILTALTEK